MISYQAPKSRRGVSIKIAKAGLLAFEVGFTYRLVAESFRFDGCFGDEKKDHSLYGEAE